jgi:hypothetical protein
MKRAMDRAGFDTEFLSISDLTEAQVRKIPLASLRGMISKAPIDWLPVWLHPHLEIVSTRRH